jgi:hypothetical protein
MLQRINRLCRVKLEENVFRFLAAFIARLVNRVEVSVSLAPLNIQLDSMCGETTRQHV